MERSEREGKANNELHVTQRYINKFNHCSRIYCEWLARRFVRGPAGVTGDASNAGEPLGLRRGAAPCAPARSVCAIDHPIAAK